MSSPRISRSPTSKRCRQRSKISTLRRSRTRAALPPLLFFDRVARRTFGASFDDAYAAWRDGESGVEEIADEDGTWSAQAVRAGRVLVDLVLELLPGRLQRRDHVLDLEHVHVLVVRGRVDEQRRAQLVG